MMLPVSATVTAVVALMISGVEAFNHTIVVSGSAGLAYTPSNITAVAGDLVTFVFQGASHSVTQSSFAAPCEPLQNVTDQTAGFDSGVVRGGSGSSFPTYVVEVIANDTIWFYCKVAGHCQDGMVGAINAPLVGDQTFDAFLAAAKAGTNTAAPTDGFTPTVTGQGVSTIGTSTIASADLEAALASQSSLTVTATTGAAVTTTGMAAGGSSNKNNNGYGSGGAASSLSEPWGKMLAPIVLVGILFVGL